MVVIGDGEHGMRMLTAMGDDAGRFPDVEPPDIIVNDAVRRPPSAQLVQALPASIRRQIEGVSPMARPQFEDEPPGPFATNAYDCVNLIALSAVQADEDDPAEMAARMTEVSARGVPCRDFATCFNCWPTPATSTTRDLAAPSRSAADGDPERARFDVFEFDEIRRRRVHRALADHSLIRRLARADANGVEGLVEAGDVADVEATELAVERRALVEAHRVHDVLDHLGGEGEQRDPPLEVVEPGGAGDQLDDLAGERAPGRRRAHASSSFRCSYGVAYQLACASRRFVIG